MKALVRRCAALGLVGLLAGCKVGPDFVTPDAPVAPNWTTAVRTKLSTASSDIHHWWKVFNDPAIDRLVETAYGQNLTLQQAGVRIFEARARLGVAVGNLYPQEQRARGATEWTSFSRHQANTNPPVDSHYWDYSIGFLARWELDVWGRFRRGIESADAEFLANIASYDDVLVSLTADVVTSYVLLRTFEERIVIARRNAEIQRRALEIATARFKNGVVTELDVTQATTLYNSTLATIPPLEAGAVQSKNALSRLIGRPPGAVDALIRDNGKIPDAPSSVAVGVPADLLRRRPDVRLAELAAASQAARIGVAKADLFPAITLFGDIGFRASDVTRVTNTGKDGFDRLLDGRSLEFFGGPSFSWKILNYGRIRNTVRTEDARYQQLIANYQDTVLKAAQETEDSMIGFLKAQGQVVFLRRSVKAAIRAVELAVAQYRDGAVDYTRVLNTQQSLVDEEDNLALSRSAIATNLIGIYRALGGGWRIREGQPPVPVEILQAMSTRTHWGGLLMPAAMGEKRTRKLRWRRWGDRGRPGPGWGGQSSGQPRLRQTSAPSR